MTLFTPIAFIIMLFTLSPNIGNAQTMIDARVIALCQQRAVDHVPDAGAQYQPGVDIKGNAVAPADIGTTLDTGIYPLRIPLQMDILERFNLDLPEGIITDANVADIMVYEDGRVTYNGQDISGQLESLCVENEIIISPENKTASPPKLPATSSDGQIEIEPLAPPQDHEIIKGEYH